MYPAPFDYTRAQTLAHALELMAEHGEDARPLSGGMSLIPLMKLRLAQPAWVVDIGRLPDLDYIREEDGALLMGGLVRHVQAQESELLRRRFPLLHEAVGTIGDVQVRNMGTVGGSLAEADPSGDLGAALLALNARAKAQSARGERWVDLADLFVGPFTTSLEPDEIITEVAVPLPPPGATGVYLKMERRAGDYAVASVGVQVALDENGACRDAGVALGAAGLTPLKVTSAEEVLRGQQLTAEVIEEAAERVYQTAEPLSDVRGPADYKKAVLRVLFKRALDRAVRRHQGEQVEGGHV